MKKTITMFAFAALVAAQSFATYIVVLRDGTRYAAKAKWTVVKGKAIIQLENGQSLQVDPALIDGPKSEQLTRIGAGANANVIDLDASTTARPQTAQQPSLGSQIKLRKPQPAAPQAAPPRPPTVASQPAPAVAAPVATTPGAISASVLDKFERAYENVGIFEKKVTSSGARSLRAELTVDTEERVFNALSATSFLMVRNAGVENAQIDMVELFMKTTNGGAAGRFQMTRADAQALDDHSMSQQDYFLKKVIY